MRKGVANMHNTRKGIEHTYNMKEVSDTHNMKKGH